ncbi:MAG: phosphoribosylaminoimidazolesuccinocarboxamide synthase [Methanothermobacter sp.]|nr:phosphoribosylaminoimidazolesuccinocarboxamide synthase [Methanothermobacter tenebrarum]MDI6881584.1 phosphoribosylaminoimidazolesuccinocarboxamide synthase [Methanothermobacter sp.]MDX9693893.1 phosphoribosylaminoimidazolesuccinocarboxamide synthase [Methanothermobacter sp.]HOQ19468.1 phosphoribosylaminoimidazolesuccinocarboxamide synthase [Methanothermobacter sp.]
MKLGKLLYTGKAKDIYETDHPDEVMIRFRDDITAGDGEKRDRIPMKGYYNSIISAKFFEVLEAAGIKTHYISLIKPGYILARKLEMIPIEVITRNIATGSLTRRYPFKEGQEFKEPIIQIDYKSDEYGDPMLNDDIAIALGLTTMEELDKIRKITLKVNKTLKGFLQEKGLLLPDFKLEFGRYNSRLLVGDEISPDTCRLWEMKTRKTLDKDLFRRGEGDIIEAYRRVASLILNEEDKKRWKLKDDLL